MTALYTIIFRDAFLDKYELLMLLLLVSGHQNMLHDIYVRKPKYTSVVFYHLESGTSNWKNYWDGQNTWGNNLTGQAKMELWHLLQKYLQILLLKSGPIFFPSFWIAEFRQY